MPKQNSHKAQKPISSSSLEGEATETLPEQRKTSRRLGTAKGKVTVPPEFFEPLSEELLRAFEGQKL